MYDFLREVSELYFIEVEKDGAYVPIGDVALKAENPPIVIGVGEYRGRGIGGKVLRAIISRAREIGITRFYGTVIYNYNNFIFSEVAHGYHYGRYTQFERIY